MLIQTVSSVNVIGEIGYSHAKELNETLTLYHPQKWTQNELRTQM